MIFNLIFYFQYFSNFYKFKVRIFSQVDLKYYLKLNFLKQIKYFLFLNFFKSKIITPIFNINKIKIHKYFIPFPFLIKMKKQKTFQTKYIKILTIGKFQERKNFFLLIKVLEKIKKKYKLIIIGEKTNISHNLMFKEIKNYIQRKKLNKNIEIKFNINHNNMGQFYKCVFVLPSTNEPASISPLEALSFRKPAICSDNNGIKYYIKNGVNGYVFKDNNSKSLENNIIKMFMNYKKINSKLKVNRDTFLNENLLKKIYNAQKNLEYDL